MTMISKSTTMATPSSSGLKPALLTQLARVTRRVQPAGVDRALRAIYSPDDRRDDHFEAVVPYGRGLRMYCDTGSFVEWRIFFYGHYNEGVAHIIERFCRPGAVVVDIGANVGCNTLLMSERVGPGGRVIAIEPHPRMFERLRRNIDLNALTNVQALECAVGEQEGALTLYSPDAAHALTARATLYADNLEVGAPLAGTNERFDVRVRALDAIVGEQGLGHIDFIKLDTQGHEMAVLAGARETIEAHRPAIVFKYTREFWRNAGHAFADARVFFDALGYDLSQVTPKGLQPLAGGEASNGDVLAMPR
jgi:FkbM family methyltransferase